MPNSSDFAIRAAVCRFGLARRCRRGWILFCKNWNRRKLSSESLRTNYLERISVCFTTLLYVFIGSASLAVFVSKKQQHRCRAHRTDAKNRHGATATTLSKSIMSFRLIRVLIAFTVVVTAGLGVSLAQKPAAKPSPTPAPDDTVKIRINR